MTSVKSENYNKKIITQYAVGGDGGDRTHDLLTASQALSRYTQKRTLTFIIFLCFKELVTTSRRITQEFLHNTYDFVGILSNMFFTTLL